MTVNISQAQALRGLSDLESLVAAVVAADPRDESDSIEWKGALNLTEKAGAFSVARAILGLANRSPGDAARSFEGCGYVVVGAEPGAVQGATVDDPASYAARINNYVGAAAGPAWAPQLLSVGGRDVLVVIVEPPRAGDGGWPLRREYEGALAGTLFIRKHGSTERADAADVDMLNRRAQAATTVQDVALSVSIVDPPALRWFDAASLERELDDFAASVASSMLADAERVADEHQANRNLDLLGVGISLGGIGFGPGGDDRTLQDFAEHVDAWRQRFAHEFMTEVPTLAMFANPVNISVDNPTQTYLPAVEVQVRIGAEGVLADNIPELGDLPSLPRPYGTPVEIPNLAGLMSPIGYQPPAPPNVDGPRTWIGRGSVVLGFSCGDLRPQGRIESIDHDTIFLGLSRPPANHEMQATWTATAQGRDGVVRGSLSVPVRAAPISLDELFDLASEPTD